MIAAALADVAACNPYVLATAIIPEARSPDVTGARGGNNFDARRGRRDFYIHHGGGHDGRDHGTAGETQTHE